MGFGRGALLWLIGIPLPIILLLAIFMHHCCHMRTLDRVWVYTYQWSGVFSPGRYFVNDRGSVYIASLESSANLSPAQVHRGW
jgi:hypothetical protein